MKPPKDKVGHALYHPGVNGVPGLVFVRNRATGLILPDIHWSHNAVHAVWHAWSPAGDLLGEVTELDLVTAGPGGFLLEVGEKIDPLTQTDAEYTERMAFAAHVNQLAEEINSQEAFERARPGLAGAMTVDEFRAELGMPPIGPEGGGNVVVKP